MKIKLSFTYAGIMKGLYLGRGEYYMAVSLLHFQDTIFHCMLDMDFHTLWREIDVHRHRNECNQML